MKRCSSRRKNIRLIPSWLSTNIQSFISVVDESISNNSIDDLVIFIVNTAVELPGQHWFLVAYDATIKSLIYYDSVNNDLYQHVYDKIQKLAERNNLQIMVPIVCSQMGDAECGVYSLMKAELLMDGNIDGLMYIAIPDDVLYKYRRKLQNMLDKSIDN